ncbi:MAG: type II toxin-antitoxin system RelE/ParE family toxin [Halanaeroarchaeum sp.]
MARGEADWTRTFTSAALDQFGDLDPHVQDRIVSKLDEIVDSEWRTPDEFLEPLTGRPFSKLRVGHYRLGYVPDRDQKFMEVHRIRHRGRAYTADD